MKEEVSGTHAPQKMTIDPKTQRDLQESLEKIGCLEKSLKDKDGIIDRLRAEALEKLDLEKTKAIREQHTLQVKISD